MSIRLHIDRLVTDTPLGAAEREVFQTALQSELTRLLTEGGASRLFPRSMALSRLRVSPLRMAGRQTPFEFGTQVARTLYDGLRGPDQR
jgi:hypothetical protein